MCLEYAEKKNYQINAFGFLNWYSNQTYSENSNLNLKWADENTEKNISETETLK